MRTALTTIISLILLFPTVCGKEEGTLIEFCRESQNKELCEQLLGAYLEQETEHQTHAEKRKPSFVRFGKRSLQAEKRKPSFVRFGRK